MAHPSQPSRRPRPAAPGKHLRLGEAGEADAVAWYRAHGFEVLDRNWRCRSGGAGTDVDGEIDIVVRKDGLLVFCEVKTRASDRWGVPALAVTYDKQRRLRRLAAAYLAERSIRPKRIRFDVASVLPSGVTMYESAF